MRPLSNFVVVELIESKEQSLIYVAEEDQEKQPIGKVIAIGPGKLDKDSNRIPMSVEIGNTVVFRAAKWASQVISIDGKSYFVMPETNILMILES